MKLSVVLIAMTGLAVASCADQRASFRAGQTCETQNFVVSDNFAGARRGRCAVLAANDVRLTILPEDDGYINDSAWYAFKMKPRIPATAKITLRYLGGTHRYVPKLSYDGLTWTPIEEANVVVSDDKSSAEITVTLDTREVWIAGQELITPTIYAIWNSKQAAKPAVSLTPLGVSLRGNAIDQLRSEADTDNVLFMVGRQHPPEITGAIAFMQFFETLQADTNLARRFREHVSVVAVPMMNPDGVIGGNWRHNMGGTDLNRDWGPFKQPETQLIRDLLDDLDTHGKNIRVFLDFHSTQRNVFYTQDDDNPTVPPDFTHIWLANAATRISDYEFENDKNPTDRIGVSKNYMYKRYGISASTYEVGDETNRAQIRASATIFAEELMKLMLEHFH